MPKLVFEEQEIVSKQEVTTAYDNGNAYIGRAVAEMIQSGNFKAVLIITEKE